MKGYYNRPKRPKRRCGTAGSTPATSGRIDADGYVSIVDRKKDMIIRGGFNVYPREIEEVMLTHPAVSLVAVIGVPDERLGEEVKAFVVAEAGRDVTREELIEWCREQMAAYKYPRVDRVPRRAADRRDRQDPQARAQSLLTHLSAELRAGSDRRAPALVAVERACRRSPPSLPERRSSSSACIGAGFQLGGANGQVREVMTQDPASLRARRCDLRRSPG